MSFGTKADGDDANAAWANLIEDALGDGNPAQETEFVIFNDGTNYNARNGTDGTIDYSGLTLSTVLSSVVSAGYKHIFLNLNGSHSLGDAVSLTTGVKLFGLGRERTVITAASGKSAFKLIGNGGWLASNELADMTIRGNGAIGIEGEKVNYLSLRRLVLDMGCTHAIQLTDYQNVVVDHVRIDDFTSTGINLIDTVGYSGSITLKDLWIATGDNNNTTCLQIAGSLGRFKALNSLFAPSTTPTGTKSVKFVDACNVYGFTFDTCIFESADIAVMIDGSTSEVRGSFIECTWEGNNDMAKGIDIDTDGATTYIYLRTPHALNLTTFLHNDSTSAAVYIENPNYTSVSNIMQGTGTAYYNLPTKEFFVPCTYGATHALLGDHPTWRANNGQDVACEFVMPIDFNALREAVLVVVPVNTQASANWDIYSDYGWVSGDAYNNHSEDDTSSTYNVTANQIYEVDVSGILSSLGALDAVGLRLRVSTVNHDVYCLGVRVKYR